MTKKIACIGSRDLNPGEIIACQAIGAAIAEKGWELHTGNALGADQAFAKGANGVNPKLVHLHLPWSSYETHAIVPGNVVRSVEDIHPDDLEWYTQFAARHHPAWPRLTQGVRKLMIRNGMIIVPTVHMQDSVDVTIAWPSAKRGGGGTGQGMRMCSEVNSKLINLREVDANTVQTWIRSAE